MTFPRNDSDERQRFSTPFTITFPEASEVDADDFVREFATLHGVRDDSVPWVGRTVQDPPPFVEPVPTSAHGEEENDATLTDGGNDQSAENVAESTSEDASSVKGEDHQEHDEQEEEVKQVDEGEVEEDAPDVVAEPGRKKRKANFNVVRSRVRRHEGRQHGGEEHQHEGEEHQHGVEEHQHDGEERQHDGEERQIGADAPHHEGDYHGGKHQHGNVEHQHSNDAVSKSGPVGKVSPVQYESLSLPNKDELAAYFHAKALYRVGSFQRTFDFHLPAFRFIKF